MSTVEDFAAAQAVEYGTYKAAVAIFHNGVLAYNVGDAVPVSNAEAYGYVESGLVIESGDDPIPTLASPPPPAGDPVVVDIPQEG